VYDSDNKELDILLGSLDDDYLNCHKYTTIIRIGSIFYLNYHGISNIIIWDNT
jgi:hypothetical protein